MNDLTKGPIGGHIRQLSAFIVLTMLFQTLYFLADLYFVGRLGKEAIAGVGLAGNLTMLVLALTQSLGVGTTSLLSRAIGRKDVPEAERVLNQSLVLSALAGVAFAVVAFSLRQVYCRWLAADEATARLGVAYLDWYIPAMSLQFPLVALSAALRGLGDMKVPTAIQIVTVLINIALAPVLIFGWGSGRPLGVAGAAMASCVAIAFGGVAVALYFKRPASPLRLQTAQWRPDPPLWGRILAVGVPAGGEFVLMTVYLVFVYGLIRPFGAAAQAGFGIGVRVMQALFLPTVAVAFATAPVVGQNFGAGLGPRVRESFYAAARMSLTIMAVLTVLCHVSPDALVRIFSGDPAVVAFGGEYLRIISWNFVSSGLVFVSASVFQGMGNTIPPLASSAFRLLLFVAPATLLSRQTGFEMRHIWYLSAGTVAVQLALNLWLLHREFDIRLSPAPAPVPALEEA
jgi:putative MATE family efflux protein